MRLHDAVLKQGLLENNTYIGNTLISMYAKCGALAKARHVLDQLNVRNVVSWSALITVYSQNGQGREALDCFDTMQSEGLYPDAITYACVLKACGITRATERGTQVHNEIVDQGLLGKDVVLDSALVDMYVKCGELMRAQQVLDELPIRGVASWNALIAGYAHEGQGEEALNCYECMQNDGVSPDVITYACMLKACGTIGAVDIGKQIHNEITSEGHNVVLGTALIDMYVKCSALKSAQEVLSELHVRDVVAWNAVIAGYSQKGKGKEAISCYEQMKSEDLCPDAITYTCILKGCGMLGSIDRGKQIHDEIIDQGVLGSNVLLGTALIDMYAKCGLLRKAEDVLVELPVRATVCWNALMTGYVQKGLGEEALDCYRRMQSEGLSPDAVSYTCVLKACGITREMDKGKQIHDEIVSQGLLRRNNILGNALVDMYAKCGGLIEAQQALDELSVGEVATWNALVAGYAQQGQVEDILECFTQMRSESLHPDIASWSALVAGYAHRGQGGEAMNCFLLMEHDGISPDAITFQCMLKACSHSGLVDEGLVCFEKMSESYGITPNEDHYTCMVDLLGRAGHLNKAMAIIRKMPSSDCILVWSALLGACQKWRNVKLGRLAFEHVIQVDDFWAAAYICMANIYAASGMQEDARKIEALKVKKGV